VVEHSLGKGEVESSILSRSTIQITDFFEILTAHGRGSVAAIVQNGDAECAYSDANLTRGLPVRSPLFPRQQARRTMRVTDGLAPPAGENSAVPARRLYASHQDQDQQDQNDDAQAAAAVVACAIEAPAANIAEATNQYEDQNNQKNGADGHGALPVPVISVGLQTRIAPYGSCLVPPDVR
jgi:hypothetical protein